MTEEQTISADDVAALPAEPLKYAFRCNNCGFLEQPEHAGENDFPASCRVCGKGVRFTEEGVKTYVPENWTILADLDDDGTLEVLERGIDLEQIVRHEPFVTPGAEDIDREPVNIERSADDGVLPKDRAKQKIQPGG